MTNEEIIINVAEACGWDIPPHCITKRRMAGESEKKTRGAPPDFGKDPKDGKWKDLPNYPEDLNACHEMARHLRETGDQFQWLDYHKELFKVIWGHYPNGSEDVAGGLAWDVVEADAPQRCEAFLRVYGLWEDGK